MDERPDFASAIVDPTKVVDYLLGSGSIASRAKARFFGSLEFSADRWEGLADALRAQAQGAALSVTTTRWGTKFVATGEIDAPNGRRYNIISVWIAEGPTPRLVTAYPAEGASP
jgi:hypothetical protein